MELTRDEVAGVADVFGALTRPELRRAVSELAFKRAETVADPDALVDDALASYHLVTFDGEDGRLLAPGPTAFPVIPDGGADLPHILDVPDRTVDRDRLAAAVADRFREEAVLAVRSGDAAALDRLLDVSYELEAWGPVDVSGARRHLVDGGDG